jgi:hypothetical protein
VQLEVDLRRAAAGARSQGRMAWFGSTAIS